PDKPQVALGVERAAFEKPALRRVLDIGEFFDRPDPLRQRRQPPGLHRPGVWGWRLSLRFGRASRRGNGSENADQSDPQTPEPKAAHAHGGLPVFIRTVSQPAPFEAA